VNRIKKTTLFMDPPNIPENNQPDCQRGDQENENEAESPPAHEAYNQLLYLVSLQPCALLLIAQIAIKIRKLYLSNSIKQQFKAIFCLIELFLNRL
jgi:hypothetical protein